MSKGYGTILRKGSIMAKRCLANYKENFYTPN